MPDNVAISTLVWHHHKAVAAITRLDNTTANTVPAVLSNTPEASASILENTAPVFNPITELVGKVAQEYQLAPSLISAIIHTESGFNPNAISPKGAIGLMQVMPKTGSRFGFSNLRDPEMNVRAGATYLKWLMTQFHNDLTLTIAAYNAGEAAVIRYGGIPPYQETQHYVVKVLRHYHEHPFPEAMDAALPAPTIKKAVNYSQQDIETRRLFEAFAKAWIAK
ncbi:MAG: lytic transglycosylase domain-containing protein [Ottowia sp.]|nr:lytic transglycosylase domain-containing protein [Ottowia sp.]